RLYMFHLQGWKADSTLEDVSEILDPIRLGARRWVASPSEFPPSWRGEWDEDTMECVLQCSILHSLEAGTPAQAAETLLNALPLIRFWGESEAAENRARALRHMVRIDDELRRLVSKAKFSRDELRAIEHELELNEAWLHLPYPRLEPRLARWAESLPSLQPEAVGLLRGAAYRWRYLLPVRLM